MKINAFGSRSGGIRYRSLNRRTDALEQHLYSFRANKLESLSPFDDFPTGEPLLSFAAADVCSIPTRRAQKTDTRKGCPFFGRSGGIPLRAAISIFALLPWSGRIARFD
jgi:hypothetical protein